MLVQPLMLDVGTSGASNMATAVSLDIYVGPACSLCRRSEGLARRVRERFPNVAVRLIDMSIDGEERQPGITATPTFVVNGEVFSLGNPLFSELETTIARLLDDEDAR